jgi:hypothetical protein
MASQIRAPTQTRSHVCVQLLWRLFLSDDKARLENHKAKTHIKSILHSCKERPTILKHETCVLCAHGFSFFVATLRGGSDNYQSYDCSWAHSLTQDSLMQPALKPGHEIHPIHIKYICSAYSGGKGMLCLHFACVIGYAVFNHFGWNEFHTMRKQIDFDITFWNSMFCSNPIYSNPVCLFQTDDMGIPARRNAWGRGAEGRVRSLGAGVRFKRFSHPTRALCRK